ncbi:hypothetical protein SAMN02745975_02182 [Geosporobacter subterraneus DSM 17957]|uniref:RNA-directed DNA polymerase n=1 Tax=Geosporobacter subterraneus DSM 17957 TaxID=1121919 RepID=A0A1M6JLF2_9FIRM|nr:hypothetical protein [Geosporobacter subterraneus]SHJ47518.1 hypothetical protein SAMN02745975_02182 [Geosporobacter subterraneus DSM 17957]
METTGLLESIVHRDNLNLAYRQVKRNKGSHGVDNMSMEDSFNYLKENGRELIQDLLEG